MIFMAAKEASKAFIQQAGDKAYVATIGGGGVAALGGFNMHDFGVLAGIAVGVFGLIVQIVYLSKKNSRERELFALDKQIKLDQVNKK